MKVVVCVKEILDPELAPSLFAVDEEERKAAPLVERFVISPFDAQAIEVALRLRDAGAEVSITLLCLGAESARAIVKYGLSLGADDAVLLSDEAFDEGDSTTTARVLAAAISKIGDADLVLTGRQAADDDAGVVGPGIAEILGMPAVTFASQVTLEGGRLQIERTLSDGTEQVEASLPALVTVSHEIGAVRYANLRETMKAARKPVHQWSAADLDIDPAHIGSRGARTVVHRLYVPTTHVKCEFIDGATAEQLASELVRRLAEAKII